MKKLKGLVSLLLLSGLTVGGHAANPSAKGFTVGQYYQGGVIFWTDPVQGNQHGLIVDINNKGPSAWATVAPCSTTSIGATGSGAYVGISNTNIMLATCPTAGSVPAAEACSNSGAQGYTDWYLPSQMELATLFVNEMAVNQTSQANGGSAFISINTATAGNYWSSTESSATQAWTFDEGSFGSGTNLKTNALLYTRCIRRF